MSGSQHIANLEAHRASAAKSLEYFSSLVAELDAAIERERLRLAETQTREAG